MQCLCRHILEEGLLPTDALLISYYTRLDTMEGDPLSAAVGASGVVADRLGAALGNTVCTCSGSGPHLTTA